MLEIFLCERKICYLRQGQQSQNPSLVIKQIHQHDTCGYLNTDFTRAQEGVGHTRKRGHDQNTLPSSLDRKNISLLYFTKKRFPEEGYHLLSLVKG